MQKAIYIHEHAQQVRDLYQFIFNRRTKQTTVREELSAMAEALMNVHQQGNVASKIQLSNWHPELIGKTTAYIMNANLAKADFQLTLAREHAYDTWGQVKTWGQQPFNLLFEKTVNVLLAGDKDQLQFLIRRNPELLKERSVYNHRATLLHYVGSNGIETWRQVVPYNLPDLTEVLLRAGADPNATAYMYQSQCTTLDLLTTSAHPAAAGVMQATVAIFESNNENIEL